MKRAGSPSETSSRGSILGQPSSNTKMELTTFSLSMPRWEPKPAAQEMLTITHHAEQFVETPGKAQYTQTPHRRLTQHGEQVKLIRPDIRTILAREEATASLSVALSHDALIRIEGLCVSGKTLFSRPNRATLSGPSSDTGEFTRAKKEQQTPSVAKGSSAAKKLDPGQ